MKTPAALTVLAVALLVIGSSRPADADSPDLPYRISVTPEIKRAFHGADAIVIGDIEGSAPKLQVGGTYRVIGVCREETLKDATLYLGNTAERGPAAIEARAGSSLTVPLPGGATGFDITFTVSRPGILHLTIYGPAGYGDARDNAYAGVYLGDVVYPR